MEEEEDSKTTIEEVNNFQIKRTKLINKKNKIFLNLYFFFFI
jgi:hypothetical protein